jgi:hypothetical protein
MSIYVDMVKMMDEEQQRVDGSLRGLEMNTSCAKALVYA